MENKELKYWVGLSGFIGLGIKRFELLRKYLGSVKAVWQAPKDSWIKVGINADMAKSWDKWREGRNLDKDMRRLETAQIRSITIEDKDYPKLLKETDYPPFILFVKGSIEVLNQPGLTVIGTRKMTEYGRRATSRFVSGLAKKLVIVSGLARGVDGWAHRVCLGNQGKTVAVLGHGLERIYPAEHRGLAQEIVYSGGALVSEYPLDYPISKANFPQRDRLLGGLSLGTLVIEGGQKSGTKITAGFAADYGREVFCVPGPIDSPASAGPAELIQQGAKLVTKVEDILEELNLPRA